MFHWHNKNTSTMYFPIILSSLSTNVVVPNFGISLIVNGPNHFSNMKVCEWLGPGYTSINYGKNAFNPYNSVTKFFFFHLFWKFTISSMHTYIPLMCVGNVFNPIILYRVHFAMNRIWTNNFCGDRHWFHR
jgi:hypothetical protein